MNVNDRAEGNPTTDDQVRRYGDPRGAAKANPDALLPVDHLGAGQATASGGPCGRQAQDLGAARPAPSNACTYTVPTDGLLDGGERYTDAELDLINGNRIPDCPPDSSRSEVPLGFDRICEPPTQLTISTAKPKAQNPVLSGSDADVYCWLQALYERQTASEQAGMMTTDLNGQGFNAFDARILSDIATCAKQYGSLTPKQAALVRRRR